MPEVHGPIGETVPANARKRPGVLSVPLSLPRPMVARELMRFGLTEKEARVYLAALELGPVPVQDIAKQSGVNRATSYLMIETLIERGLMSSVERAGKKLFMAEPPERLRQLLTHEEERILGIRVAFDRILPELSLLLQTAPERPRVRFYEGIEGLEAMRTDFFTGERTHELLLIAAADDYHKIVGIGRRLPHAKRIEALRNRERCIFTSDHSVEELRRTLPLVDNIERRRIPSDRFPLAGEVAVFGNKIALLSYQGKVMGVLVESAFLAQTVTSLFNLAWETADRFEKMD